MAEHVHEQPQSERIPTMDAVTLEGRTRPGAPTLMLFGRPVDNHESPKPPVISARARSWLRSLARGSARS